jgi:hypothetical protein
MAKIFKFFSFCCGYPDGIFDEISSIKNISIHNNHISLIMLENGQEDVFDYEYTTSKDAKEVFDKFNKFIEYDEDDDEFYFTVAHLKLVVIGEENPSEKVWVFGHFGYGNEYDRQPKIKFPVKINNEKFEYGQMVNKLVSTDKVISDSEKEC